MPERKNRPQNFPPCADLQSSSSSSFPPCSDSSPSSQRSPMAAASASTLYGRIDALASPPLLSVSPSRACPCPCSSSPFASSPSLHPPVRSDSVCHDDEFKRLLLRVSSALSTQHSVPESLGYQSKLHSLLQELVQRFFSHVDGSPYSLCPGLEKWIEALAGKPLNGRIANSSDRTTTEITGSSTAAAGATRKRKRHMPSMLSWVKGVAVDPTEDAQHASSWKKQVLEARRGLFVRLDEDTRKREFASKEPHKKCGKVGLRGTQNQPTRRSERIANNAYQHIHYLQTLKKRIGVGPTFQADLPDWKGPPDEANICDYKEDPDTLRWLGIQVWPLEGDREKTSEKNIGKARSNNCACCSPGSLTCIRSHVNSARFQLKADLGRAFTDWGFEKMGEEVSKLWNDEDQMKFNALENLNRKSEFRNFWEVASKYFSSKSKQDLISYYFNVFLLRRISNMSRLTPESIDTEEDDYDNNDKDEQEITHDERKGSNHVGSRSRSHRRVSGLRKANKNL